MSQRDQLVENIEDAFMSLFMADVAEYEGQKFIEENERLKSDTNFKLPSELDRRCIRTINKIERKKRARSTGKRIYRVFSKLSVAAVIALALFTSAYAAFPSVRATTLNLLIQVSDIATELTFGDADDANNEANSVETPSDSMLDGAITIAGYVLPESITSNYQLIDEGSDQYSSWATFSGDQGSTLYFDIAVGDDSNININTEDASLLETISTSRFNCIVAQQNNGIIIAGVADSHELNLILITFENVNYDLALSIINNFINAN